jgi:hypothetical protein
MDQYARLTRHDDNLTDSKLTEEELDKIQKEFLNAIRSVNISLVEDLIHRYQGQYNIINRPDREKDGGRQTSLFSAVVLKDKEACFNITKMLLDNGTSSLLRGKHRSQGHSWPNSSFLLGSGRKDRCDETFPRKRCQPQHS